MQINNLPLISWVRTSESVSTASSESVLERICGERHMKDDTRLVRSRRRACRMKGQLAQNTIRMTHNQEISGYVHY